MRYRRKVSPIYAMWLLIAVTLAIFVALSFSGDIKIGNYTPKKAKFRDTLLAEEKTDETLSDSLIAEEHNDTIMIKEVKPVEPDTTVHQLLIFGDSMTHNLAMSISKYGTKNNYKVTSVTWESSSIPGWNHSGKIKKYLNMVNPDFIIISLGANDTGLKNFDVRIPEIKKIVEQLDSIPYIWVGPPLWAEDKGLYPMLEKALPKGKVFKADTGVEIQRGPDHIHPTHKGADVWADTLMRWIKTTDHPILAERPDSGTSTKGHQFIYLHQND